MNKGNRVSKRDMLFYDSKYIESHPSTAPHLFLRTNEQIWLCISADKKQSIYLFDAKTLKKKLRRQ